LAEGRALDYNRGTRAAAWPDACRTRLARPIAFAAPHRPELPPVSTLLALAAVVVALAIGYAIGRARRKDAVATATAPRNAPPRKPNRRCSQQCP
jgi:hypothetical protein